MYLQIKNRILRKVLLSTVFLCIIIPGFSQYQSIILGRPTANSITASILFDKNADYTLEYGESTGQYTWTTSTRTAMGGTPDALELTGLGADKHYYYRLKYKSINTSSFVYTPEYNFHTQRAKGSSFTFTIEADEHLYDKKGYGPMYQVALNNQAADKPDFMISLGDIFGDDHTPFTSTALMLDTLHRNYRPYLGSICHSIPFFICLGNHEGENDFYMAQNPPENLTVYATKARKFYYPNPSPNSFYTGNTQLEPYGIDKPENYYSWVWGDALFVVLDVYRDQCDTSAKPTNWAWSLGKTQYDWLKTTLETSKEKYKFVFAHHIRGQGRGGITNARYFEWGGWEPRQAGEVYTFAANRPGWAKPIHQLFVDNKVNIFFQGHDHVFARETLDSVTYLAVPMTADSSYMIGKLANAGAYVSDTLEGTGHIRVNVSPSGLKVDFVRAYLPKDTLSGLHKNREVPFTMTVGQSSVAVVEPIMTQTEVLGRPTDKSIVVHGFFDQAVEVSAQYGISSTNLNQQTVWTSVSVGQPMELLIVGLNANTRYYYRVCYRNPGSSSFFTRPTYTFSTQKAPGTSFTFLVQADPHMDEQSDTTLYKLCLKNQLEDKADFMIDLGDFLMTDKLKNAAGVIPFDTIPFRAKLLRSKYEISSHSTPLFISLGNHEGEAGWNLNGTANNIAVWGTNERKKYFPNPYPDGFYTGDTITHNFVGRRQNYYAWTWGDALFIVLDPYWYTSPKPDAAHGWYWSLGKVQYDWLRKTLESSKSKFKFVFAHQIIGGTPEGRGGYEVADLYEWGGKNLDGTTGFTTNRNGWYKPIKDLLKENRATIFFHGHDHFYGKQDKDCLVYQETPQPSHPNFSTVTYATDYGYVQGKILPNSGHMRINVSPAGVTVDYVRAYLPANETATRKNKDVSATYFIGEKNCYDSTVTSVSTVWNTNYVEEMVYPNPFKQSTRIDMNFRSTQKIVLQIFDQQGKLVRTLLNGNTIPQGNYTVVWDGNDNSGRRLAAGMYHYIIKNETADRKSGKIVLMY